MTSRVQTDDLLRGYMTEARGQGALAFVASTSGVKRDGLDLDPSGGSWDNYMRNPVFLWVHDYWGTNMPIGKVTGLSIHDDGSLRTEVEFDLDDPFAAEVHRKYRAGFLNAVSIGWDTLETDGNRVTKWDLLDVSAVPVPGDPDALIERAGAAARRYHRNLIDRLTTENAAADVTTFTDPSEDVSVEQPADRPARAAVVEQIDQAIDALIALRDGLADSGETPEPTDEPDLSALTTLADLLGGQNEE